MNRMLITAALAALLSTEASAWGLGDIGGQILRKGAESAVSSAVNGGSKQQNQQQAVQGMSQSAEGQATDAAATLNNQQPQPDNTVGGVATGVAANVASDAASNAMARSGIPGAAVAGNVAGGLVKGVGGLFKKKPQPAAQPEAAAVPAEAAPQP